ncbi:hypothetical protein POM88_000219 [Heracleum sosnowskyi]|uniref:PDZ domain-containing protein n=1 Tax=Heracleum sosnowskyi TaxID=360622 RepID=A0AAD8JAS5_9APIA|nr:hypothetical protein POM88_000219 [Heracleum sosnowskyi]
MYCKLTNVDGFVIAVLCQDANDGQIMRLIAPPLGHIARVVHKFPDAYKGLVVKKIIPDSSADVAGLLVDDVIIKCDEKPVESFLELDYEYKMTFYTLDSGG